MNPSIAPDTLPSISKLSMQELSPHYAIANAVVRSITIAVVLTVAVLAFTPIANLLPEPALVPLRLGAPALTLILTFNALYQWFGDRAKRYALRELDISFEFGLITRKLITQPLSRIQHVEVSQGPIERRLALATLLVYSAGSATRTFAIPGLTRDNAERLRQHLLDHVDDDAE